MVTVVSPLDHTGGLARLIAKVWVGATPLLNQYSGRHSTSENWLVSFTEYAADVTIGRIQVGEVPGDSAQVIVPACCAPVAGAGMVPNAPLTVVDGEVLPPALVLLLPLLLQAASAVRPATARAAILTPGRAILLIAMAVLPLLVEISGSSAAQPDVQRVAQRIPDEVAGHHGGD